MIRTRPAGRERSGEELRIKVESSCFLLAYLSYVPCRIELIHTKFHLLLNSSRLAPGSKKHIKKCADNVLAS